ncbi:MAG: MFS transporter [Acidimicrobiia bacterium]|nr:MFS transporter [Acidimicrobiia bacterium]
MPNQGVARSRFQLVLRGQFARLWWAGAISSFGDWVSLFATLALGDMIGGGTGTLVPLLGRFIPGLLFGALGGVLADRLDRKRTMILTDVGRGALVLSLIWVQTLPQLFAISFVLEMLSLLRQPAREAAMPTVVDQPELLNANSLSVAAAYGSFPFGALGWSAISKLPDWLGWGESTTWVVGYTLDSLTFVLSALIVATMVVPLPAVTADRMAEGRLDWRAPLRDLTEGWRFVVGHKGVRIVIFGMAAALFGGGAIVAQGQPFAREFLGGRNSGFAVLATALGAGAGLGVMSSTLLSRLPLHRTVLFAMSLFTTGASMLLLAFTSTVPGAVLWSFLLGFGAGLAYVVGFTYLHERVDDAVRGRTFAALFVVVRTALLVSMTVAAIGATALNGRLPAPLNDGIRTVFAIGGLVTASSGLATLWLVREVFTPGKRPRTDETMSSEDIG